MILGCSCGTVLLCVGHWHDINLSICLAVCFTFSRPRYAARLPLGCQSTVAIAEFQSEVYAPSKLVGEDMISLLKAAAAAASAPLGLFCPCASASARRGDCRVPVTLHPPSHARRVGRHAGPHISVKKGWISYTFGPLALTRPLVGCPTVAPTAQLLPAYSTQPLPYSVM
ncbi:unnamed protein product [Protopolystoma xenopodis]|uniref:Uncharacterized protein n=1 Tax=Protopolystoma xenopodis TaxID=117903 RepID=A0A448XRX7_9PLAT|nr:unnamed protein product [Protopolystoma xenopodis]